MADTAYTSEAAIDERIGSARLAALKIRDGVADAEVVPAAIRRAGRIIRRQLRQRYGSNVDSIAAITDNPATPGEIQEIAVDLVLFDLYAFREPGGAQSEHHRALAHDALEDLQLGDADFAIGRASAAEGQVHASYTASTPKFAGVDDYDVDRTRGI